MNPTLVRPFFQVSKGISRDNSTIVREGKRIIPIVGFWGTFMFSFLTWPALWRKASLEKNKSA